MIQPKSHVEVIELLGGIDVYLLDQIVKGRLTDRHRVLDVGCGAGRNLSLLMQTGHQVYGVDPQESAIESVRQLAQRLRPDLDSENFYRSTLEECPFPAESFDLVISNAVLHFATGSDHFARMLRGSWRFLAPGGLFFCRLASSVGIENFIEPQGDGCYRLGDRSTRYLVDLEALLSWTEQLGGRLVEPIKTTNVQNLIIRLKLDTIIE